MYINMDICIYTHSRYSIYSICRLYIECSIYVCILYIVYIYSVYRYTVYTVFYRSYLNMYTYSVWPWVVSGGARKAGLHLLASHFL